MSDDRKQTEPWLDRSSTAPNWVLLMLFSVTLRNMAPEDWELVRAPLALFELALMARLVGRIVRTWLHAWALWLVERNEAK